MRIWGMVAVILVGLGSLSLGAPSSRGIQSSVGNVSVSLNPGWNSVALQCQQLTGLSANAQIVGIASFTGGSYTLGNFALADFNAGAGGRRGFWVFANAPTSFTYTGTGGPDFVDLTNGYNLVSFATSSDIPGSSLTASVNGTTVPLGSAVLTIFTEIGASNAYTSVDMTAGGTVRAGQAYWVFANGSVRLSVGAGPSPSPSPGLTGITNLYVADSPTNTLLRFANPGSANGDVTPTAVITGGATTLNQPMFLYLDQPNDRLYVPNTLGNSIAVFNQISTRSGNTAPDRILSGAATGLNGPIHTQLDTELNLLYVSNAFGNTITVYSNAATLTGNLAPVRTISGPATGLVFNHGMCLDLPNNRLYISNLNSDAVNVWDNASSLNGNVGPTRVLSGSSTGLDHPLFPLINPAGELVVSNRNGRAQRFFGNAASVGGNVAPVRVLTSAGNFDIPHQILLDQGRNQLYVANPAQTSDPASTGTGRSILVFNDASSVSGDRAPDRTIKGLNSLIRAATGIAAEQH